MSLFHQKAASLIPGRKGLEKEELDLSGKKINEVISLRSRNPIPYYFPLPPSPLAHPLHKLRTCVSHLNFLFLDCYLSNEGSNIRSNDLMGADAVTGGHCNCTWRHEARQKLKASPWSPSGTAHLSHISAQIHIIPF